MSWSTVMFATPSPRVDPIDAGKVARITAALDARLELFHCAFDGQIAASESFAPAGVRKSIQRRVLSERGGLERLAAQFRARGLRVTTSVRWDSPVHEGIVRQILRHRPRLLIARPSRRGPVARYLLSRTDWKLIETCPCPILLLKSRRPYASPLVLAAVDPGHAHDKPAALDERILDAAAQLSDALSGHLLVFHARTPRDEQIQRDDLDRVEARVLELAGRHHLVREQVCLEEGPVAEALPRYANREKADMVVMGAVARSRLRRALIGHTAERVLDALECDVLIIKPPGFHTGVGRQSTHHVASGAQPRIRAIW